MNRNESADDKSDKNFIDVEKEINEKKQERIRETRGKFSGTDKKHNLFHGIKAFLLIILFCSLIIVLAFLWKNLYNEKILKGNEESIRNTLPSLKLISPSPVVSTKEKEIVIQQEEKIENNEDRKKESEDIRKRKFSSLLRVAGEDMSKEAIQLNTNDNLSMSQVKESDLQNRLESLRLDSSVAGKIINPDYTITQGTMIDCQLETKMITTQAGMVSCYTTRNIYSTNGHVVLIDRGSKIVGNYQGGIQQGQARIFVLWTRIQTPKSVIINIDSPGSGPLGESGIGGDIDTHFWKRFGGAIMMSLIGDFGEYASSRGNENTKTTIQLSNTTNGMQQAAVEALKNSINIPPTLYKNQGERISIFVARDLDFSKVYGLKLKEQDELNH